MYFILTEYTIVLHSKYLGFISSCVQTGVKCDFYKFFVGGLIGVGYKRLYGVTFHSFSSFHIQKCVDATIPSLAGHIQNHNSTAEVGGNCV